MTFEAKLKTDHADTAVDRFIDYFRGKPNIEALCRSYVNRVQELETAVWEVINERTLSNAVGVQLTNIGKLVGIPFRTLSNDDSFRTLVSLQLAINRSNATVEELKSAASVILNDVHIADRTGVLNGDGLSDPNTGTVDLPGWIVCYRASEASTIVGNKSIEGIGNNVARCFSPDGVRYGILGEPSRLNRITDPTNYNVGGWSGSAAVGFTTDFAGNNGATKLTDNSAGAVEDRSFSATVDTTRVHTASVWALTETPPTPSAFGSQLSAEGSVATAFDFDEWLFLSVSVTPGSSPSTYTLKPRPLTSETGAARFYGPMYELGVGFTTFMGWDGVNFERATDILEADAALFTDKTGHIDELVFEWRPHYSSAEAAANAIDHDLIRWGDSDRFYLLAGIRFVWRVNGNDLGSSSVDFDMFDVIRFTLTNKADGSRSMLIEGMNSGNGLDTANDGAPILGYEKVYLLGNESGIEYPSEILSLDTGIVDDGNVFTYQQEHPLQARITLLPEVQLSPTLAGSLLHKMRAAGVALRFAYHVSDSPGLQLSDANSGNTYSEGLADVVSGSYGSPLIAVVDSQLSYDFATGFVLTAGFDAGFDAGFN